MSESLWSTPHTFADGEGIGAYKLNRYLRDPLTHLYAGSGPRRVHLAHEESIVTAGNALSVVRNAGCFNNYYAFQDASADADAWTQSLVLLPGSYYFEITYRSHPDGGIIKLALDEIDFMVIDTYVASGIPYQRNGAYVWVDTADRVVLSGLVTGKAGASGGYNIQISSMSFKPNIDLEGDF